MFDILLVLTLTLTLSDSLLFCFQISLNSKYPIILPFNFLNLNFSNNDVPLMLLVLHSITIKLMLVKLHVNIVCRFVFILCTW